jgi:hypothetical protein
MSDLVFYVGNLVDQSSLTLSNENALFPAENIQDHRRSKVIRSTTNSDNLVLDTGETSDIDSFFIVDNPRSSFGVSGCTLQLHGSNSWGSPSVSQSITLDTTHGSGYYEFTSTQQYRWARVVMTSTLGYCELSKIFLGMKLDLGRCQSIGWSFRDSDNARVTENRYGQKFIDTIIRQKEISMTLSLLDKDQLDQIWELWDTCGISKPFFMRCTNLQMMNSIHRHASMYFLKSSPQITNTSFGRYSLTLSIEEAL